MKKISFSYRGYRFPPEIIHRTIWRYLRFTLSLHDVEDLLAERGITVSYETIRRWVNHFGPLIAADLRRRRPRPHTTWYLGAPRGRASQCRPAGQDCRRRNTPRPFGKAPATLPPSPGLPNAPCSRYRAFVPAGLGSIREIPAYISIRRFESEAQREARYKAVYQSDWWKTNITPIVDQFLIRPTNVQRIVPTPRSPVQQVEMENGPGAGGPAPGAATSCIRVRARSCSRRGTWNRTHAPA